MKKVCLFFVATIILVLGISAGYIIWYNLPINKINRAFDNCDYKVVTILFDELGNEEDRNRVKERLAAIASEYYDEYVDGDISYKEAIKYFELVNDKVLKKDKDTLTYYSNIKEIEQSRMDYEDAILLMEEEKYIEAIELFFKVSELDEKNYKKAALMVEKCKLAYCDNAIEEADSFIEEGDYESALDVIQEALNNFSEELTLKKKLDEIREYLEVDIAAKYSTTYDFGDMISDELGLAGYDVYFPATLCFELSDNELKIYVDPSSIESALDALTSDEESMKAVYALAEDYGIKKKEADLLIQFTYGGSYTRFIMDNFGSEIESALGDFTHEVKCYADNMKIYIGTTSKNDSDYLTYTDGGTFITLDSYTGNDGILKNFTYPLKLTKSY